MVKLCERANETYSVINLNIRDLLLIEGRRLVGVAGQAIDSLFPRLDKRRYYSLKIKMLDIVHDNSKPLWRLLDAT